MKNTLKKLICFFDGHDLRFGYYDDEYGDEIIYCSRCGKSWNEKHINELNRSRRLLMIVLTILLAGFLAFSCPAHAEDWSFKNDKQLHLMAGTSVGTVMLAVGASSDLPAAERFWIGLGVVAGVALAKEGMDAFGETGFSVADAVYTIGGGASVLLFNFAW